MRVLTDFPGVRSELPSPGSQAAETTQLHHPCSGHLTAAVVTIHLTQVVPSAENSRDNSMRYLLLRVYQW